VLGKKKKKGRSEHMLGPGSSSSAGFSLHENHNSHGERSDCKCVCRTGSSEDDSLKLQLPVCHGNMGLILAL
jgi:hypothetical protein